MHADERMILYPVKDEPLAMPGLGTNESCFRSGPPTPRRSRTSAGGTCGLRAVGYHAAPTNACQAHDNRQDQRESYPMMGRMPATVGVIPADQLDVGRKDQLAGDELS